MPCAAAPPSPLEASTPSLAPASPQPGRHDRFLRSCLGDARVLQLHILEYRTGPFIVRTALVWQRRTHPQQADLIAQLNMSRIGDQALLHGAAMLQVVLRGGSVSLRHWRDIHDSLYAVGSHDRQAAFLLKHSTSPGRRWQFRFTPAELAALESASRDVRIHSCVIALICKKNGVCCLSGAELEELLSDRGEIEAMFVTVTRPAGGSYRVLGPNGNRHPRTVPANAWPARLFEEGK